MLFSFELFGVFIATLSGALLAARREMDVFGFLILGGVTGLGGGTIRDIILDTRVFWVQDQAYLIVAIISALLAYFLAREPMNGLRRRLILWFDAVFMAFFTVVGSLKAYNLEVPWLVAILMGAVTATAGGVVRDIIAQEQPFITRGEIYATASLLGASVLILLVAFGVSSSIALFAGFSAAFLLRMVAIIWGWRFYVRPADKDP